MNKNQLRCAFTWPGNTGKSTIIQKLAEDLSYSIGDNKWCDPNTVSVYPETARKVLDDKWFGSMSQFQQSISALEDERLKEIAKDTADILLIDRTITDWSIYQLFNTWLIWEVKRWSYDLVVLFTSPIKETNTKQFEHYNSEILIDMFKSIIKHEYWDIVLECKNGMEDYIKIKKEIYKLLNDETRK